MHTLPVSFTGSYTEDGPNFPPQNILILQKKSKVAGDNNIFPHVSCTGQL